LEARDSSVLDKKKVKFGTDTNHLHGLLELDHVDVWVPTKNVSLRDCRYFVSAVDDYSRHCWVYLIRQRVEAVELLVKWKNLMKTRTSKKIKELQHDHVEEYQGSFLQFG